MGFERLELLGGYEFEIDFVSIFIVFVLFFKI